MAKEIERKFLVTDTWFLTEVPGSAIKQGYLSRNTVHLSRNGTNPCLAVSALAQGIAIKVPVPKSDVAGLAKVLGSEHVTVRIRIRAGTALLTIKGPTEGISRDEFEYGVPLPFAQSCLTGPYVLPGLIEKTRYCLEHAGNLFEVDVFEGKLAGLVLAEVELQDIDSHVELPDWIGEEVSDDPRYFNSNLAKADHPPIRTASCAAAQGQ